MLHVRVVALDACLVERKPFAEELAVAFARIVERTLQTASSLGCLFGLAAVCASGVGETIGKLYYYGRKQVARHVLFAVSCCCHFASTYYICGCGECQSHREERSLVGIYASGRLEHGFLCL